MSLFKTKKEVSHDHLDLYEDLRGVYIAKAIECAEKNDLIASRAFLAAARDTQKAHQDLHLGLAANARYMMMDAGD